MSYPATISETHALAGVWGSGEVTCTCGHANWEHPSRPGANPPATRFYSCDACDESSKDGGKA